MLKTVTIRMDDGLWEWLRRHGFDVDASAGALLEACAEEFRDVTPAKRAAREKRAQEITAGRRRRADG